MIAKLRAYHFTAQTRPDKAHLAHCGLDLIKGTVRNNVEAGVLEAAMSKVKIIQVQSLQRTCALKAHVVMLCITYWYCRAACPKQRSIRICPAGALLQMLPGATTAGPTNS